MMYTCGFLVMSEFDKTGCFNVRVKFKFPIVKTHSIICYNSQHEIGT